MFPLRKLVFFRVIVCLCSSSNIHRGIFEELPDRNNAVKQDGTITNLFHKRFHQCSIDKDCNYVVHYVTKNEYKKVGKHSQLPFHQHGYKIWKKMTIKEQQEGQAAILASQFSSSSANRSSTSSVLPPETTATQVSSNMWDSNSAVPKSISLTSDTNTRDVAKMSITLSLSFKPKESFKASSIESAINFGAELTHLRTVTDARKDVHDSMLMIHLGSSVETAKTKSIINALITQEVSSQIGPTGSFLTNEIEPTLVATEQFVELSLYKNMVSANVPNSSATACKVSTTNMILATSGTQRAPSEEGGITLRNEILHSPLLTETREDLVTYNNVASKVLLSRPTPAPFKNNIINVQLTPTLQIKISLLESPERWTIDKGVAVRVAGGGVGGDGGYAGTPTSSSVMFNQAYSIINIQPASTNQSNLYTASHADPTTSSSVIFNQTFNTSWIDMTPSISISFVSLLGANSVMSSSTMAVPQTPTLKSSNVSPSKSTTAIFQSISYDTFNTVGITVLSTYSVTPTNSKSEIVSSLTDQNSKASAFALMTIDQYNSRLSMNSSQSAPFVSSSSHLIFEKISSVAVSSSTFTLSLMTSLTPSEVVKVMPLTSKISESAFPSSQDAITIVPSSNQKRRVRWGGRKS